MKSSPILRSAAYLFLLLSAILRAQEAQTPEAAKAAPVDKPVLEEGGGSIADPFGSGRLETRLPGVPADRATKLRIPLRLRLETWSAPAMEVAKRLDELRGAESLAALRVECLAGQPGVTLVHSPVTTIDSSTNMEVEAISERIYPTEYEPPEVPALNSLPSTPKADQNTPPKVWPDWLEKLMASATPTSFETRNTGTTLTAVAQPVAVAEKNWDLVVTFESVDFAGVERYGENSMHITMPVMGSFRTGGLVRLKEGQWRLLSVTEPPRGVDGKPSDQRWVTLLRIDPEE